MTATRGVAGAVERLMRARPLAGLVMAFGVFVALISLLVALALTSNGIAFSIFIGILLTSCLVSCLVAWQLTERAASDLDEQVEQLARQRDASARIQAS